MLERAEASDASSHPMTSDAQSTCRTRTPSPMGPHLKTTCFQLRMFDSLGIPAHRPAHLPHHRLERHLVVVLRHRRDSSDETVLFRGEFAAVWLCSFACRRRCTTTDMGARPLRPPSSSSPPPHGVVLSLAQHWVVPAAAAQTWLWPFVSCGVSGWLDGCEAVRLS